MVQLISEIRKLQRESLEILNMITAIQKTLELFEIIDSDNQVILLHINKKKINDKLEEIRNQKTNQLMLLACELRKIKKNDELKYEFYEDTAENVKMIKTERKRLRVNVDCIKRVIKNFKNNRIFDFSRESFNKAIQFYLKKYEVNKRLSIVLRKTLKMKEELRSIRRQLEMVDEQKRKQKILKRKIDDDKNDSKQEINSPRKSQRMKSAPLWLIDFVCAKK
ncbi:uncharacterized protein LOC122850395 [Aphidius gifuensis]|uniref:uncharacterized protein LOC122850395 n=1 Tax=Aphidius gifuensis TaxID=684658 RepID=UPI001CDBB2DB|nr:uncharacterized protein LOC122850395 [Aphidius gifuensis]